MAYKKLKDFLVPFSISVDTLLSKAVYFDDQPEEEEREFREYVHSLTKQFWVVVFLVLTALILITWPTDYLYFDNQKILNGYLLWRAYSLLGLSACLLLRVFSDLIDDYFVIIAFVTSMSHIFASGLIFGYFSGFQDPWFYLIYTLPTLTIVLPAGLSRRILLTFLAPLAYFTGFLFFNLENFYLQYPGLNFNIVLCLCLISILIGHAFYALIRQNYFQNKELKLAQKEAENERERAEDLLVNILPEEVSDRLKAGEDVSENFDSVTVLFADIVAFTPLANQLPASDLVSLLDNMFSKFDDLVNKYGVEKIKTIGDEYFITAGVPVPMETHALTAAELAFDMRATVENYTHLDGEPFQLRIGMNTGPVTAGIIGKDKFIYDLWGDTVNIGSRMESQGIPGKIQVTPATKEAIEDQPDREFDFEKRGAIEVKGKGTMTSYFLKQK